MLCPVLGSPSELGSPGAGRAGFSRELRVHSADAFGHRSARVGDTAQKTPAVL